MATLTNVPIVTLRDMVVYPHGVQPLFIGTETVSYTHLTLPTIYSV